LKFPSRRLSQEGPLRPAALGKGDIFGRKAEDFKRNKAGGEVFGGVLGWGGGG